MSRGNYSTTTSRQASSLDETTEFKALRVKYSASLKTLNEMFPDWSDVDLLSALKETDGSLEMTIAHIAEGKQNKKKMKRCTLFCQIPFCESCQE